MSKMSDAQIMCEILKNIQYIPENDEELKLHFSEVHHNRVRVILDIMAANRIIGLQFGKWGITLGNGKDIDQYEYIRVHDHYRK